MNPVRQLVVVGGVAAGMSAAAQAKRRHPEIQVVVFERGNAISYGACGMPYNIADPQRTMDDLIVMSPEKARKDRGIDLRLGTEVMAINPDDGGGGTFVTRSLDDGSQAEESYDALVIATGAQAVMPPIPGREARGVSVLRTLDDGEHIRTLLDGDPGRAVIVGGGYIGLEMAHALAERQLQITLVEKLPDILPGWSSSTVATVRAHLEEKGVRLITRAEVEEFEADSQDRVRTVRVDGTVVDTDLVVVATGIRPSAKLAHDAGLRIGDTGAIWVDQYQRSSDASIWVAGDCSEAYHRVLRRNAWIPLGTTANKQGRIAGANATGSNERFAGIVGTAGFVVFDLEVARTGLSTEQAKDEGFEPVAVTIRQNSRAHGISGAAPVHVTLVADGPTGLVLGAEIVGRDGAALRINPIAVALASHMSVRDLQNLDFVYAPPFAPVWDPVLVAANQLTKKVGRST